MICRIRLNSQPGQFHSKAKFDEPVNCAGIEPFGQGFEVEVARDDESLRVSIPSVYEQANRLSRERCGILSFKIIEKQDAGSAILLEHGSFADLPEAKDMAKAMERDWKDYANA